MKVVNLTPHEIKLNDGTIYPKTGIVAGLKEKNGNLVNGIRQDEILEVENLPQSKENTIYIVSMPTLLGLRAQGDKRKDVVCPVTRGEGVKKNEKGWIVSVPCLRTF